jgi:hypothetical protein
LQKRSIEIISESYRDRNAPAVAEASLLAVASKSATKIKERTSDVNQPFPVNQPVMLSELTKTHQRKRAHQIEQIFSNLQRKPAIHAIRFIKAHQLLQSCRCCQCYLWLAAAVDPPSVAAAAAPIHFAANRLRLFQPTVSAGEFCDALHIGVGTGVSPRTATRMAEVFKVYAWRVYIVG